METHPPPYYARLAHPPRAVERGLSTDPGGATHRWEVLRTDLPALDPSRLAPPDQMASLVDVLRLKNAAAWQDQVEAPVKTPTSAFPQFAIIWWRNLGVADDGGLPHIYHLWANSTKAERRTTLQTAFNEQVESGLSASRTTPLATKELYKMVVQGQLASHLFKGEDLSKGLSPFTCAFRWGSMTQQSRYGHCALTRCSWGTPPQPWQSTIPFIPRKCPSLNPSMSWALNSHA